MLAGLFCLLSLVLLVLLLWGLIKPGKAFLGKESTRGKVIKIYGLGFIVSFIVFAMVVPKSEKTDVATAAESQPQAAAVPVQPEGPVMPKAEADFIAIVAEAQQASRDADNDMQRGGFKATRDKKLCSSMKSLQASNWLGKVTNVSANSDGKGVLEIEIAKHISVTTWNNAFSDMEHHTLLEPGTPLFNTASTFKKGQTVQFSGRFFNGTEGDCIAEGSLSLDGKLRDPEFVFRFADVAAN